MYPNSTSAVKRTCGKAARPRDAPGAPKVSRFSVSSGTFRVDPSNATRRRPRYHAPRVTGSATGFTRAARNASNGAGPRRVRAREIDDFPDTRRTASDDTQRSPSIRQRSTSRADTDRNSPRATTKYTIASAGRARWRRLPRPHDANASRTDSIGYTCASTPMLR